MSVDQTLAARYLDRVKALALDHLREAYEESTIPWIVEVANLADTDAEFRDRVRREGVRWTASANG